MSDPLQNRNKHTRFLLNLLSAFALLFVIYALQDELTSSFYGGKYGEIKYNGKTNKPKFLHPHWNPKAKDIERLTFKQSFFSKFKKEGNIQFGVCHYQVAEKKADGITLQIFADGKLIAEKSENPYNRPKTGVHEDGRVAANVSFSFPIPECRQIEIVANPNSNTGWDLTILDKIDIECLSISRVILFISTLLLLAAIPIFKNGYFPYFFHANKFPVFKSENETASLPHKSPPTQSIAIQSQTGKFLKLFLFIASTTLLFGVFYNNILNTAEERFDIFEKYSDHLVEMPIITCSNGGLSGNRQAAEDVYSRHSLEKSLCPLEFSDENWSDGVHRKTAAILVANNKQNRFLNQRGSILTFQNGLRKTVQFTKENGTYLEVHFSGDPLPFNIGYPWMYRSDKKIQLIDYSRQAGVLCRFFTFVAQFHPPVWFYSSFVALALAITLTSLAFLISKDFSKRYSLIFLLAAIFSHWLVMMGRSLYWAPFLFFIPGIFMCLYLSTKRKTYAYLCAFSLLIKFLNGYEFLTSICLATCVPIIYFCVKEKWKFSKVFKTISFCAVIAIVLFLLSVAITCFVGGENSFEQIFNRGVTRTFGVNDLESKEASLSGNFWMYFMDSAVAVFPFPIPVSIFIIISLYCAVSLIFYRVLPTNRTKDIEEKTKKRALGVATLFSLLAPWSWFLLAKNHSHVHSHINHVLYAVPFIPMALMCIFAYIETGVKRLWTTRTSKTTLSTPESPS